MTHSAERESGEHEVDRSVLRPAFGRDHAYRNVTLEAHLGVGLVASEVVVIPPEDPDTVRERDGIPSEPVGRRPMVDYYDGHHAGAGVQPIGRRAPNTAS